MNIYQLGGLILGLGGFGGLVICLLTGTSRFFWGYDAQRNWLPGWAGSAILGAVASLLIWAIYGASASFDLFAGVRFEPHLTVAQLASSVLVGMGGSRILTLELQKQILQVERKAEAEAKNSLTETLVKLLEKH